MFFGQYCSIDDLTPSDTLRQAFTVSLYNLTKNWSCNAIELFINRYKRNLSKRFKHFLILLSNCAECHGLLNSADQNQIQQIFNELSIGTTYSAKVQHFWLESKKLINKHCDNAVYAMSKQRLHPLSPMDNKTKDVSSCQINAQLTVNHDC